MGNKNTKYDKRNYHNSSDKNGSKNVSTLMQSNALKDRHVSMEDAMTNDSISTDENASKDSKTESKLKFVNLPLKDEINKESATEKLVEEKNDSDVKGEQLKKRPKHYNNTLMSGHPLGLQKVGEKYYYNFWVPETSTTMRDFIEVHGIPIYELSSQANFMKYCNENGWYNSGEKYKPMWESVRQNPTRILFGVRSKFDVHITLSDCFVSANGHSVRAYSITGGNKMSILRAFNYFSDSWNAACHLESLWHHDNLFQENVQTDALQVFSDRCGEKYSPPDIDDTPDVGPSSNANAVVKGSQKRGLSHNTNYNRTACINRRHYLGIVE